MENQKEKIDLFSKILVATSAINYLANSIYALNSNMKSIIKDIDDKHGVFKEGVENKGNVLQETVNKLSEIMETLGDCLNNCDAIMDIDERITAEAFSIIVHGKDSIDKI